MDFIWSQYSKSWNLFYCSVHFFYGLLFNWGRVFNYIHQNTSSLHQKGRPDLLALAKVFSVKTSRCSTSSFSEIRASIFSTYVWFEKKTIRLWVPKKVTLSYFAPHIGNLVGRPPKICIFLRNLHNFNNKFSEATRSKSSYKICLENSLTLMGFFSRVVRYFWIIAVTKLKYLGTHTLHFFLVWSRSKNSQV